MFKNNLEKLNENSNLINCDNIKISIVLNNEDDIEKDSLEFENKILAISKNLNLEDADGKEICYGMVGSPAIWLKNKKRGSITNKNIAIFSTRSPSKTQIKNIANKSEIISKDTSFLDSFSNLKNKNKSPIRLKIKHEEIEKNIPLYPHHTSFLQVLQSEFKIKNIDESSFNLNMSINSNNPFKTLINNKIQNKNQENKFNNLNYLKSKLISTIDRGDKTEIDEIINTEISEIFFKNNNLKDKNTIKSSLMIRNKVFKIKTNPSNNENIFSNLNPLRISKTHPNSENESGGNSNSNSNSNSDKAILCNIRSKSNSDNLENIENNNSECSKNSQSSSLYKTINEKLQLNPYLHKTFNGKIKWKAGEIIAEGSSSVVCKALNEDEGYIFVVKIFNKFNDPKFIETFNNEVRIFKQLEHPNIIKYIESEELDSYLFIYLEYVSGGSIKYIIDKYGPLKENLTKIYLKQILDGLEYLHSQKIVHRDIKCANILLDVKGNIKLSDFGCSGQMKEKDKYSGLCNSDEFLDSLKGTLQWMAPEVILQQKYGKKADIWSLGCTLLEFATGQPPWGKFENCYQAMTKIGRSNDIPQIPDFISEDFKDFLLSCFKRNPKERPNIVKLKQHQFIKGYK